MTDLSFTQALEAMRQGLSVARRGWEGVQNENEQQLMYIYLLGDASCSRELAAYWEDGSITGCFLVGEDVLTEDWYIGGLGI